MQVKKVLTANDVGHTGAHQAGMLVPKSDPGVLRFFPTLNHRTLNPRETISVRVPELSRTVELQYIYYNNKLVAGGTRNEFRLTGLTSIFRALEAQPDDALVLTRMSDGHVELTLERKKVTSHDEPPSRLIIKGWTVSRKENDE